MSATAKHARVAEQIRQNPPSPTGGDRHAQVLEDARELFDMLGLTTPGGRELLPDPEGPIPVVTDVGNHPGAKHPDSMASPRQAAEAPNRDRSHVPAGLRNLPARTTTPTPPKRRTPAPASRAPRYVTAEKKAAKTPRKKGPKPQPIPHGEVRGYRAHYRRGELPVCDPCREAYNEDKRRLAVRRRAGALSQDAAGNPAGIAAELEPWLEEAQRSPSAAVARAAATAVGNLMALRIAVANLARIERDFRIPPMGEWRSTATARRRTLDSTHDVPGEVAG